MRSGGRTHSNSHVAISMDSSTSGRSSSRSSDYRHVKRRKRGPVSRTSSQSTKNIPPFKKLKLWFLTLFYHYSFSYDYVVDTLLEPLFWLVDHLSQGLGRLFVAAVIIFVASIVFIAHVLGIPFWNEKSPAITALLAVIGYWNLINLTYNFYKVATVCPGLPADQRLLAQCTVTISWVNNCVGHFNRRYFFLCMFYIVGGCIYIMLFGVELAFRQIILDQNVFSPCYTNSTYYMEGDGMGDAVTVSPSDSATVFGPTLQLVIDGSGSSGAEVYPSPSLDAPLEKSTAGCDKADEAHLWLGWVVTKQAVRMTIFYAGFLCVGASLALGGLFLWHARLITNGETSIEYHINRAERKKLGKAFVNRYDIGKVNNWKMFLGLDQPGRSFFLHILLPSSHKPTGNGYDWSHLGVQQEKSHWDKLS